MIKRNNTMQLKLFEKKFIDLEIDSKYLTTELKIL